MTPYDQGEQVEYFYQVTRKWRETGRETSNKLLVHSHQSSYGLTLHS